MSDPYKILGVSSNATDDEIKKAYRALVKKYHPDNYRDSNLSELATEKMQQVNEAYEMIQKMRSGSGYSSSNQSYDGPYSNQHTAYVGIRSLISMGNFNQANSMLDQIPTNQRDAEWHFLKANVLTRKGWYHDALSHFDIACTLDPNNYEYQNARDMLRNRSKTYGGAYRQSNNINNSGCSSCDMCTGLICADCCCEMCGGDLISCC